MTLQDIDVLFFDTITKTRGLSNKVKDFSKDVIYNWQKGRTTPTLGDKLSILHQMNLIKLEQTDGKSLSK